MKRNKTSGAGERKALLLVLVVTVAAGLTVGCSAVGAVGGGLDNSANTDDSTGGDPSGDTSSGDTSNSGDAGAAVLDTRNKILHLSFDGDASDETATSVDGIFVGAAGDEVSGTYGEDRHGNAGSAAEFSGSSFVRLEDVALGGQDAFTITAWLRDDGSDTVSYRRIASYVTGQNHDEVAMRIRELNTQLDSWRDGSFEGLVENSGRFSTRTTELVMPGSWTHVALVFDGAAATGNVPGVGDTGELRLYQDGRLKNSKLVPVSVQSGNLVVGGGKGQGFHGRIDDMAVFTRALSDAEIALAKEQILTDGAPATGTP